MSNSQTPALFSIGRPLPPIYAFLQQRALDNLTLLLLTVGAFLSIIPVSVSIGTSTGVTFIHL